MTHSINREKLAEVTSGIGAGILGVGIGIYLADRLVGMAIWFVLLGVTLHGWGMFDRHRSLATATGKLPWWWQGLYAVCWVGLAALLVYAFVRGASV
jgi:hypothetical protein